MNLEVELIAGVVKGGPPPENVPSPRLIKIFIAGERDEFSEERKHLLEIVGPELQSIYEEMGIEVLLVDMQYGTSWNPDKNPYLAEYFLEEIKVSRQHSRGCFLLMLVGSDYTTGWVPTMFDRDTFEILSSHCTDLNNFYELNEDRYRLKATRLETGRDEWQRGEESTLRELLKEAAEAGLNQDPENAGLKGILKSTAERQLDHGLSLDEEGRGIVAVVRDWTNGPGDAQVGAAKLRDRIRSALPGRNLIELSVPYRLGGIDGEWVVHDSYLSDMRQACLDLLQQLVNESVEAAPEIKSRKKMVQEIYAESLAHLVLLKDVPPRGDEEIVQRVKQALINGKTQKHGPVLIKGGKQSGKTSLLSLVYTQVEEWLGGRTYRVARLCASTPRSSYSLELLRLLCQQLSFLAGQNDGTLPRDASFDPLYLNNWFTEIVLKIEQQPLQEQLVVLLDDLHRLHPLDCDIVAALSWLPLNLPPGVHFIVTTNLPPEMLRLTPLQRERLKSREILVELAGSGRRGSPYCEGLCRNVGEDFDGLLEGLARLVGESAAQRIGSVLSLTEFGLAETELLELVMPTGGDEPLELSDGVFNFSTWCWVRWSIREFLMIRVMSGKLLFSFQTPVRDLARKYYFPNQESLKACETELSMLFFAETSEQSDKSPEEPQKDKETPFQSKPRLQDITYTLRHVEEAWLHMLRAGDAEKLKKLVVCAFDFLLAAVQMISVSYLRCVLEHSRRYLLERDLELVYYAVRKTSDVLTKDPLQLGAQLICWLRPVAEDGGDLVSKMVTAAMAWCDGYTAPLLVPLNGWLQQPLPLQIRALTCPQGVKLIEVAPSGQHLVIIPHQGNAQLWHVMSAQLVHTFKGHSGPITCVTVPQESHYLLTGSEDTSIIVWDMKQLEQHLRIKEHIAAVSCIVTVVKSGLIVSGGEDSRIIATSLQTGDVVARIDHHRGPVTSVRVNQSGDILVSGSADATVCLWYLENFSLLNCVQLPSPAHALDISRDSVFLLVACEDQRIYLHSMATGTEIHKLRGHHGSVTSLCLAKDCRRAVAGGADGRISVFDIHTGKIVRNLPANPSADVTCVKVTEKDDFLITASGNKVTYWSFRGDENVTKPPKPGKPEHLHPHSAAITCLDISRDGAMAVTGGVDSLVNLWQLNSHELMATYEGHIASVTCVAFSASGLFVASGSEDKTVRVWGLTLGVLVSKFRHQAPVTAVTAMLDGRRIVSSDRLGTIRIWAADSGTVVQSVAAPGRCLGVSSDMRYAVCGTGDNHVRILTLGGGQQERHQISHAQDITCLVITPDSQSLITGSRDMSLKVWQLAGGKLSQVLVGHTDHVTCVAVSVQDKSLVVSGSRDANLIVWDIHTGNDLHTLKGHLGYITCVKISGDGALAVSGSEDKSLIVWDTRKGVQLSSILLHVPVLGLETATDFSRLVVYLLEHRCLPILCLHNTPAQYVKLPHYVAPRELRPPGPKRPAKRLLKKEVSLDTYTWQRKYGHLTSGLALSSLDAQMKRRFSVSASMEEISKAGLAAQSLGPEQAALVQSQHFDQLEAIWNRQSPPPRPRGMDRLKKQSSLQGTRISDSEEDEAST